MPAAKQAVHEAVGYHICCLTITVMTMHAQCFTVTGRACSRLRAPIQARHLQLVIASSTSHTAAQPAHSLPIGDQMNQQQRLRNGQASSSLQHAGSHDIVQHLQSEQKPFTAAHHGSKRRRLDYASGHRAPQVHLLCWLKLQMRACQRGLPLLLQPPADMHIAALPLHKAGQPFWDPMIGCRSCTGTGP